MLVDLESAKQLVLEAINAGYRAEGNDTLVISEVVPKPYGWVFSYTSKRYLETNDISDSVVGNGPIVFEAASGKWHQLGSLMPEERIKEFEKEHFGGRGV